MIAVVFLLAVLTNGLVHEHQAEANLICRLCDQARAKKSSAEILSLCHVDEDADCSGTCRMLAELRGKGKLISFCDQCKLSRDDLEIPIYDDARISKLNDMKITWKAGRHERFHNATRAEFRRVLGTIVDDKHKCRIKKVVKASPGYKAPESFDSETNWPKCKEVIGDIRDQSMCGCCWAFGGASAASDRMCIQTGGAIAVPLSAQDICFCANSDGCDGGQVYTPWQHTKFNIFGNGGTVTGGQYQGTGPFGKGYCSDFSLVHCHHHGPQRNDPYPPEGSQGCPQQSSPMCPSDCDSDATSPHDQFDSDKYGFHGSVNSYSDESAIQEAIQNQGPVETAFTVYMDFASYTSGVYKHVSGGMEGGHAVRIVGWGVDSGAKYWKVANSWNPYWGESGYFRIARGNDECGIESGAAASSADSTWGKKKDVLKQLRKRKRKVVA